MKNLLFTLGCLLFITILKCQPTSDLWGMASNGGAWNGGTIFKTDGSGQNSALEYAFKRIPGMGPYGNFIEASDGMLYGLTRDGATEGPSGGTILQLNPNTGEYKHKYNFVNATGSYPYGSLMQASDGMLYGLASFGGSSGSGVLFKYNITTGAYINVVNFDGPGLGATPWGSVIESGGKLYGMTKDGGTSNLGVLFSYDLTSGIATKLIDFNGTTNGSNPYGSLFKASDGMLYGMTYLGGTNNKGTLFQFSTSTNTLTLKIHFNTFNGERPWASLIEPVSGKLFGTTTFGGTNNFGTIFSYDISTSGITTLFSFSNGKYPQSDLYKASDNKLYGTTYSGGLNNKGTLFQFDPITFSFANKIDLAGVSNGTHPYNTIVQASNGKVFGMIKEGGIASQGVIYQYNLTTSAFTKLYDLNNAIDGHWPNGALALAPGGKLYGMTNKGGLYGYGVLFQYDPVTKNYVKKIDFDSISNGSNPNGNLFLAANGKFYGMTTNGGVNNYGVLFEYDHILNTITKKVDFSLTNGIRPSGNVIQASNGKLYGMTSGGGFGRLFSYDIATSTYSVIYSLNSTTDGSFPNGSLMQANDGNLYGLTFAGGSNGWGTLFQYNISTSTFTKKINFLNTTNGANPYGSLIQASNNKLYGLTNAGGASNVGILFSYDFTSNTLTNLFNYPSITYCNGGNPQSTLIQASDGNLYAMTSDANIINGNGCLFSYYGYGTVTQYNIATSTFSTTAGLGPLKGDYPRFGNLIEIASSMSTLPVNTSLCAGGYVAVPFGAVGTYPAGNVFTAELSNAAGSFASPIAIGSIISGVSGTINAVIPPGTPAGSGYRIRVNSSNPALTGTDNGTNITIGTAGLPTITVASGTTCAGQSFTMVPSGALSYTFSSGSAVVNPTTTSTYTISGTAANGCSNFTTATLSVNQGPIISASNGTICSGKSFTIVPSGAISYTFQGGSSVVSPTITTSYNIMGTNAQGCVNYFPSYATVYVNASPTVGAVTTNSIICGPPFQGTAILAFSGSATSYTWSTGSSSSFISVSPSVTTTYTITGTAANGCTNTATFTQSVSTCTGMQQLTEKSNLEIYPNPFANKITVINNGHKEIMEVYNSTGALIFTGNIENGKTEVDLSKQSAGVYFIRMNNYTTTLIKQQE